MSDLAIHPLFTGLTRPPMRFGVTITFLMLNGGLALMVFILFNSFMIPLALASLMHGLGYICCLYDPRMFDILLGKIQTANCRNTQYWGCNSYEPY